MLSLLLPTRLLLLLPLLLSLSASRRLIIVITAAISDSSFPFSLFSYSSRQPSW